MKEMRRIAQERLAFEDRNTLMIMGEALFAGMVLQLTNPFYQLFASAMGADDVAIGLISSLPAFCALFVLLPASLYIDRVRDKKKFLATAITVCGVILPIVALSPFLGDRGYWFFIIGISLWNIPYICYTVSWQSYFSDLYPPSKRAIPYARRQMTTYAVPIVTIMAGGLILSYVCKTQESKILAYQIFFTLAFVASIFQRRCIQKTEMLYKVSKQDHSGNPLKEFVQAIKNLRQHPQFCLFLGLLFVFYFSWQMAWPMFFLFLVKDVGFNEATKSLFDVTSYLSQTLMSNWWGRRIDKYGPRGSTILGLLGSALVPAWTVFTRSFPIILTSYIFSGGTGPGFQLGLFNDMLDNLPEENKSLYIGIYNMVMQISNFVAPLFGVALYTRIGARNTMYVSSVARFFAAGCFFIRYLWLKKRETKAA